jgi:nucleoside-diphosphate-sugar epimerase
MTLWYKVHVFPAHLEIGVEICHSRKYGHYMSEFCVSVESDHAAHLYCLSNYQDNPWISADRSDCIERVNGYLRDLKVDFVYMTGNSFASMPTAEGVDILGVLMLAHACQRVSVGQLVQVSNIFPALGETSPLYDGYALPKRQAQELAQLYGEGEPLHGHQPLLDALLKSTQRSDEIVLDGRNDARRNFLYAADVAETTALVVLLRTEGRFDCASMNNVRLSEIAASAVAAFGSASTIRFDSDKPDIPDNAFAADDTLYRHIGYFPQISLLQGLAREAARRKELP